MKFALDRRTSWEHWTRLALAALLFITPWVLAFAHEMIAAWNAWGVSVAIALLTVAALVKFAKWQEWGAGVLGLWVIVTPWALGLTAMTEALWAHVILGALIVATAGWCLWRHRDDHEHQTV